MPRRSLEEKRCIITGASSGIGRALALQLAEHKCHLLINARRAEKLDALSQEIEKRGGTSTIVEGDITDPQVRLEVMEKAKDLWDAIDILINNAGIGALGEFTNADEDRMRRVLEVNFFAPAELSRICHPILKQGNQPILVNISSVLAHRAVPLKSEYCASKFALHGWSDALRAEWEADGIDVLLISPSTTSSEFFDNVIDKQGNSYKKMSSAKSPEYVARRTLQAIQKGRHEILLSWSGWAFVWIDRLFPTIADRLVARYAK